ncbi:MAG TPA: glycoside hydrolase family 3 N-terminal domain-containing protein [Gemmatimonadales bacterium]|nr:glycoside hydrolase family 3 N-terminal domain-containing protein [Gemmatimonadales bacterium]
MRHRSVAVLALALAAGTGLAAQPAQPSPYRDPDLPVPERVRDLLARMTLEEKFWQLFMLPGDLDDPTQDWSHGVFGLQITAPSGTARGHAERINAIQRFFVERTRLGIPIIPFEEAVHGLAREGATMFPQAIALAATWDTALVARVAGAIARETGSRGIRQVLSPVLNLASDVRWGRVEETYGEDSYLASLLGRAFVAAFEHAGIVATPKHFVANVGEGGRDSYPIDRSERTLEEVFFPPFKAAIQQAHARSIMTAYNSVDGAPATQDPWLLTTKLKREWGFTGFVISDAAATGGATVLHHTEPTTAMAAQHALEAGLDVIFQSSFPQHRPYLDAFRRGLIADSVIAVAVGRVLRAKFELGLFEHPYADPDSAARWNGHPAHRALALEAARASIVLLRNERRLLPLSRAIRSVAVIGTDAEEARLGGYSGPGIDKISILAGLQEKLGAARVRYAPGPGRLSPEYVVIPAERLGAGLRGEYFDNIRLEGEPRLVRSDARVDFLWTFNPPGPGIPRDWYSVRWTGTLSVPPGGVQRIGVEGNDGYRLYLDGRLLIDNWKKQSYGARLAAVTIAPGSRHQLRLEYFESTGNARVRLVWDAGVPDDWRARLDSAVATVRRSEAAIVVAGIEEGEFRDRASLSLPGHQEELILRIAETGKPVVVVLVGGSAITMSRWLDRVAGVLAVWYPGEQGGRAVADVLFGEYNPAGRLPLTFPLAEGQLPLVYNHKPTGRGDDYLDLTGRPLFPVGYGLSYTSFEYSQLSVRPEEIGPTDTIEVRCRVKNTGARAGDEIVQLYLRDVLASLARPVLQLAGFQRVHLQPGEEREVRFALGPEHLRMLDREMRWVVEPGTFRVLLGASSVDIRLRGEFRVR